VDSVGLTSKQGAGTARLADEGAGVISSAETILSDWNMERTTNKHNKAQCTSAGIASSMAEYLNIKL
jgi:hypothetical protein